MKLRLGTIGYNLITNKTTSARQTNQKPALGELGKSGSIPFMASNAFGRNKYDVSDINGKAKINTFG